MVVTGAVLMVLTATQVFGAPPTGADYLVGMGAGSPNPPRLRLYGGAGQAPSLDLVAYGAAGMGLDVAGGNVDGGAEGELLTAPGPSPTLGPHVRAFRRAGAAVAKVTFYAYGTLRYGARVGSGDVDGDAFDEILTTPGPVAVFGPHVRAFDFDGAALRPIAGASFFAFGNLAFGAQVAGGDIDGGSAGEVVAGAGAGPTLAPHVRAFRLVGNSIAPIARVSFMAFPFTSYGVGVAAGDVDGDGFDELVATVGPGPTLPARIAGFDDDGGGVGPAPGFDVTVGGTSYGALAGLVDVDPAGGRSWWLAAAAGPDPAATSAVSTYAYDGAVLSVGAPSFEAFAGSTHGARPASGESERRLVCEGSADLCDRPYNQVSVVCTHNAMSSIEDGFVIPTPNQRWSFLHQLDDGVRCMMLDTYMDQGEPKLCHAYCGLGATPWVPMLQSVRVWLDAHPREVLSFVLEAYISEAETQQALVDGGVFGRVYHHAAPPGSPWPTLRQLIERDQRLVIFTDDAAANGDWHLDWRAYGWETPYDDPTFTCVHGRGAPAAHDNQVFILNHYVLCPAGGCESNGTQYNAYLFLLPRASACWRFDPIENPWTQIPTFVNVDHYHVPISAGGRAEVFDVVDALNRAWPTPP